MPNRRFLLLTFLVFSCALVIPCCQDPHSEEDQNVITPIWNEGEDFVRLTVSSKIISGSVSLNIASLKHSDKDITEGITAVLSDSGMTIPIGNVQSTISGDVLVITLSHDNVENLLTLSDEARLEITLATGDKIVLPCHGSQPASVYFNTPMEGYDEGIILESGEYALLRSNSERGGWDLIVGIQDEDPVLAWIDETGLFRMLAYSDHVCVFEFHENDYDIIWSDGEADLNIPYSEDVTTKKPATKAEALSTYQNGALYASLAKLHAVGDAVVEGSQLKDKPWYKQNPRTPEKLARWRAGCALLLIDELIPDQFEAVHDGLAVAGLALSIASMNPLAIAASAWEVGSIAVQRYYFGYATLQTLAVIPITARSAECMAALTKTEYLPWKDSRSSEVEFIVNGADGYETRQSALMENDIASVEVDGLKPGGHYSLQTRMYRVWIHNNNSHRNFGLSPEDFKKDLTPFNERIDRSWVSLYGGEEFFTMPMPGAETGGASSITDKSAVLSCSFSWSEGFTCGVMISSDNKEWSVSASPSSTSVSVGGLDPMTTYTYWAYVDVDGIPVNGVLKTFTTDVPSLEGTWTWTQYMTDYAGNRKVDDQFSITLLPDKTISGWSTKSSFHSGEWDQAGRSLYITIYSYMEGLWSSGGYFFTGEVTDDSFNKVAGYRTTWHVGSHGYYESSGLEAILSR